MSRYVHTRCSVANRGQPPSSFLDELTAWAKTAPADIFAPRQDDPGETDVYTLIKPRLGPWTSMLHRRAAMCEVLRVLAGFESSWKWNEGVDVMNRRSMANKTGEETGAWQVSWDSRVFGPELKAMSPAKPDVFIAAMKANHVLAMEYAARLLRHTIRHNGPVKRGEILPWLSRDAVAEFMALLA